MKNRKLLFYQPREFTGMENHVSGSTIRPIMMKNAFKNLGYSIKEISGAISERKIAIDRLLQTDEIKEYDFMYVESSNIPLAFSNANHFPVQFNVDIHNFDKVRKHMKVGFFYRDFFWCKSNYSDEVPFLKRNILKAAFRQELKPLFKAIDVLYLPELDCINHFPIDIAETKVLALHPACKHNDNYLHKKKGNAVRILYSGNIEKNSVYNLTQLLQDLFDCKCSYILTINCEKSTFERNIGQYPLLIKMIEQQKAVIAHYDYENNFNLAATNDIAIFYLVDDKRKMLGMPMKIFDYLSMGLPIITNTEPAIKRLLEQNQIGWYVDNQRELEQLIFEIESEKKYNRYQQNVISFAKKNTWEERCKEIIKELS